jgi:ATP-dependent helicase HrpB
MILRPHREPEIRRIDLSPAVLDIIAWGGDPETFEWFERPQEGRITAALTLLNDLGAIEGKKLTEIGQAMQSLPLHPRLARMVIASEETIPLAAELSDGMTAAELGRAASRCRFEKRPQAAAIQKGFPDRVAMRRGNGLLLATGTGARLAREIEHTPGDFFVVLEIRGDIAHRVVPIERDLLEPTRQEITHTYDDGRVKAIRRTYYRAIVLHEQQVPPDPEERRRLLAAHRKPVRERRGPETIPLPSGRTAKLEYRDDGTIVASVKLQELFGLAETPRIGEVPVTFELLAPNGRPVQVTRDLRSFWNGAYQQVRKELRARYPKHPWPEDPWTAPPTHRTKRNP